MIYQDKSKEEIEAALDRFIEGYSAKIGKVDLNELKAWASKKYKEKVEAQRELSFGTLTPKSLEDLMKVIDERMVTPKAAIEPEITYDQFMKLNENDSQVETKKRGRKAKS